MLRIGHGYDVHRFAEGRPLILGGVAIPSERGLLGHSDADVCVHALMDALCGAARLGDIGQLFPDSDPAYEGANSLGLLSQVMKQIRAMGYELLDCDCTIAAQAPRVAPYREAMRQAMAEALQVPVDSVGLAATTTERLGFVGREEGMEAWAVCLLQSRPR